MQGSIEFLVRVPSIFRVVRPGCPLLEFLVRVLRVLGVLRPGCLLLEFLVRVLEHKDRILRRILQRTAVSSYI